MHIPDGILPLPVSIAGYVAAAGATWYSIYQIKKSGDPRERIPKAALVAAAFFAITLISVPIPPTTVHLLLSGLMGVLLGFFSMPAILVALFFQAMVGHGGLTTIGVNAVILGLPALCAALSVRLYNPLNNKNSTKNAIWGFAVGSLAAAMSWIIFALFVVTNIPAHIDASVEKAAILSSMFAHIPVVIIEGVATAFIVVFYVRPNRSYWLVCDYCASPSPQRNSYPWIVFSRKKRLSFTSFGYAITGVCVFLS